MKQIDQSTFNSLFNIIENFPKIEKKILVVGDLGVDKYTLGIVERISPEAPVPVLEVSKEWMKLGLSANVSHNLSVLGINNSIYGVIGNDTNGDILVNLISNNNIDYHGIVRENDRMTTFKERVVAGVQQICRIDYESKKNISQSTYSNIIDYVSRDILNSSALIIQDYGKGLLSKELTKHLISIAKQNNVLVLIDPSRDSDPTNYVGADLLKPNLKEAQILSSKLGLNSKCDVVTLGKFLIDKLELKTLVITLGGDGMIFFDKEQNYSIIPAFATEVYDVSGAGDTTIAVLTLSLICNGSLREACWIANSAAGVVVAKSGTATVNFDELKESLKKLGNYIL